MLPLEQPNRIHVAFDDHRLVANAGLLLPMALARHPGLAELVGRNIDLGRAPGRANKGNKVLTLVASALAGGDYIDDADALRAGGADRVMGCTVKAPSTLGSFLRSFQWGHVRQLDRVSRGCWPEPGPPASVWASTRPPPRPCGGVSSPWPDGSPARPAASPCTFPKAGPGKTTSAEPWHDCAPCHSLPDVSDSG